MILFFSTIPVFMILIAAMHYSYAMAAEFNTSGSFFLVRLPFSVKGAKEVQALFADFRCSLKKLSLLSLLFSMAAFAIFLLPKISEFRHTLSLYLVLLFGLIFGIIWRYHRLFHLYRQKVLALKTEHQWYPEEIKPVLLADLTVSRLKNRRTPSSFLFVLPALGSLLVFFTFPQANLHHRMTMLLLSNLLIHLLCFTLQHMISHAPAKIYCEDRQVNLLLNQEYRQKWTYIFLVLSGIQVLFYLGLTFFYLQYPNAPELAYLSYWVLIAITAILPIAFTVVAYRSLRKKESELLQNISGKILSFEEDNCYVYHPIFGYLYNNPNNPAALVDKPVGIGQTMNLGTKKGRIWFYFSYSILLVVIIGSFALLAFEDFLPPVMQVTDTQVRISRTLYPYEFSEEEIESIELLDTKPLLLNLSRNVGSNTGWYRRGLYSTKDITNLRLYYYLKVLPVIRFQLQGEKEGVLYYNSATAEDTRTLWESLAKYFPEKIVGKENAANSQRPESDSPSLTKQRTNFIQQEIDYSIPRGNGTLHAVLNMPVLSRTMPAVLIIGGSGPSTKEGVANLYLDLAMDLWKNHIAVVRYDKRGIARSASVVDAVNAEETIVFEDFVGDATALLTKMKADPRFSEVFVLGHSEGALVGTLAMQEVPVDGLLCVAGAGRNIAEVTLEQIKANPHNPKDLVESAETILKDLSVGKRTEDVPALLQALFRPSVQPYLISWMAYDPAAELTELTERYSPKLLILQGENDSQVQVVDAERLHAAAPQSKLLLYPNMTHMLKDSEISKNAMYQSAENAKAYSKVYQDNSLPIQPQLIEAMSEFINKSVMK